MPRPQPKPSPRRRPAAALLLGTPIALAAASCASAGFSEETRKDIAERMATIQEPITQCYEAALTRNRKLAGAMTLAFTAENKTGQFKDVAFSRNDLPDPELEGCIRGHVVTLKLTKPTTTNLAVEYPLEFAYID
jgi:hypothetical protein